MFKVGQKVWDVLRGPGVVQAINKYTHNNPISVQFGPPHGLCAYTREGTIGSNFKRSLFFSEPKIEAATEPVWEPTLKKGDLILVKNRQGPEHLYSLVVAGETQSAVFTSRACLYPKTEYEFYKIGEKIDV